jgi:hypothetical protein
MIQHSKFIHKNLNLLNEDQLLQVLVLVDFDDCLSVIVSDDCQAVTITNKKGISLITKL